MSYDANHSPGTDAISADRTARAQWCSIAEGGDLLVGWLIDRLGALEALTWVQWVGQRTSVANDIRAMVRKLERPHWCGSQIDAAERDRRDDVAIARVCKELRVRVAGWSARICESQPLRNLEKVAHLGGEFIVPGDPQWPLSLAGLGLRQPYGLWARKPPRVSCAELVERSVAVVGARAASADGRRTAADTAYGLAEQSITVVSGAAFGIDAAAHKGAHAFAAEGSHASVAILACGVDEAYPRAHERLLDLIAQEGMVLSEYAPGTPPLKHRFLIRNRLIAGISGVTVIVEAAKRSGALNTAHWAQTLMRPVGAFPGPATSRTAQGCHVLLRETDAVLVTNVADIMELAPQAWSEPLATSRSVVSDRDETSSKVLQAMSTQIQTAQHISTRVQLAMPRVVAALGLLELTGRVAQVDGGWLRSQSVDE